MRHVVLRLGDLGVRKSYWARSLGARSTQGRHLHLSPPTMAKVTKNDEGKEVVLSDPEELAALTNPTVIDVRGEEEVAKRAAAPGAINVVWNRAEENFFDPSKLPGDKDTPIIVN
jgi:hypothetical protein